MTSLEFEERYEPLFTSKARYVHLWGGRGRGGSFTATQYALHLLTTSQYFRGYLMREIFSDIRESLWRDFKDRIAENETINERDFTFNDAPMSAVCNVTGNVLLSKGFKKSAKNRTAKLKSIAGATHVIIEEADEISEDDFKQLDDSLRTIKGDIQIVMIFNPPPKGHWIWRRWYVLTDHPTVKGYFSAEAKPDPSLLSIHSTYADNYLNLNASFIHNLLNYQTNDPDYYANMVLGLISEGAKGRIYRNWKVSPTMSGAYEKFYGLDWGFNDPVALVEVEMHNKDVWACEKIYEREMTNAELSARMKSLGISKSAKIYADCAEPKSIKDLKLLGWNIIEAEKGPGSIISGIKMVKEYTIHATADSKNLWQENENYRWSLDQHKNPTNDPIDEHNHLMDAIRYAITSKRKKGGLNVL